MSADALEAALRAAGIAGTVTADGVVAVLRVAPDDRVLEDAARRRAAIALASEHGFRSLALEVAD
jgi:hypothetical protein